MASLILTNISASPVGIFDLGIYLQSAESLDLVLNFQDEDLIESLDLEPAMVSDFTVHLDGITLMSYSNLIDYLTKLVRHNIIDGNKLYIYDRTRLKTLSTTSVVLGFGTSGNISGKYLEGPGAIADANSGWPVMRNSTIISVASVSSGGLETKTIDIQVNNISVKSFNLVAGKYVSTNDDIDIAAGDYIQAFVSSTGVSVKDPAVSVELAWRL